MNKEEKLTEQRKAELETIRSAAGGVLSPEAVVEFARNENTALHSYFTWDDTEAAREYRLWQARQVIRVCVTVSDDVQGPPIRTYVSLHEDRGNEGYRLLTDVLSDSQRREKLLIQSLNELQSWQQKYSQLKALAPIFAAAERVRSVKMKKPKPNLKGTSGGGNGGHERTAASME